MAKQRKVRAKDSTMPVDFWHYPFNPITGYHTGSKKGVFYYREQTRKKNENSDDTNGTQKVPTDQGE